MLRQIKELLSEVANACLVGDAANVEEAIYGILKTKPDIVILDIQMPGGSGIDVLKEIKNKMPETKFIVFTNYTMPQYREKCIALGAEYFLDKSFDFNQVPDALSKLSS